MPSTAPPCAPRDPAKERQQVEKWRWRERLHLGDTQGHKPRSGHHRQGETQPHACSGPAWSYLGPVLGCVCVCGCVYLGVSPGQFLPRPIEGQLQPPHPLFPTRAANVKGAMQWPACTSLQPVHLECGCRAVGLQGAQVPPLPTARDSLTRAGRRSYSCWGLARGWPPPPRSTPGLPAAR